MSAKAIAKNTYPLDSMALSLPYAPVRKSSPLVFRLTVTLTEEIDPAALGRAVRDLAPRFPIMYTRFRPGFIWGALEDAADLDVVRADRGAPCRPFRVGEGEKPLLRVLYRGREMGIECTHLTCDGHGGAVYLNSLAARYLELRGHAIEKSGNVLDCRDRPDESELEDCYRAASRRDKRMKFGRMVDPPAFMYRQARNSDTLRVTKLDIPIDALKGLIAEKYDGCTITNYLCAVYTCAFLGLYKQNPSRKKPVRISVATDLRNLWGTRTLRNFVGYAHVNMEPGRREYGFREVLAAVRGEMEEQITLERQQKLVCQNIRYLDYFVMKFIPGFLKRAGAFVVLPAAERWRWPHTSTISNVGYINLPPSLARHIEKYTFLMGEMRGSCITCTAAGCRNTMTVAFTAVNESTVIQDFCADFLRRDGLSVVVY